MSEKFDDPYKDLLYRSQISMWNYSAGGGYHVDPQHKRLIDETVKECIRVMYDDAINRKVPPDIDKLPTRYATAILEHFKIKDEYDPYKIGCKLYHDGLGVSDIWEIGRAHV